MKATSYPGALPRKFHPDAFYKGDLAQAMLDRECGLSKRAKINRRIACECSSEKIKQPDTYENRLPIG